MKQHLTRYVLGFVLLLILLAHSIRFQGFEIPLITRLDAIIYDTKIVLTMPKKMDDRVVILDLDEKSLAEIGRWPWGRDKLAVMVNNLFDKYHIEVLGFDAVFAERDDTSGLLNLDALARKQLKDSAAFQTALNDLRPELDFDAQFAKALKGRKIVLGYFMSSEDKNTLNALPTPVLPAGTFNGRRIDFRSYTGYGGNLDQLQQSAASGGFFNMVPDNDGSTRRVPMLAEYDGAYYESLSLAMVRQLLGNPRVVPGFPANSKSYTAMEWIDLPTAQGTMRIPVDENVSSLVPFRGIQGSFKYISAADVIAGRAKVEDLQHKLVILGTTAAGLKDLRVTPVSNVYAGVEVHANLIAGMLDNAIKFRPSYVMGADVVIMLLAGSVMVVLLPLLSASRATIAAFLVLLFLLSINFSFWLISNLVLPLANSLTLVFLLYLLNMSWGYFVESRSKRQFTELFGQYVPPELVDEMAKNPEGYSMEGKKAELTVLFSDVRGFTTISEGLAPDQLTALMNEYLGAMTDVIRGHRGTLDKYIGDLIMAFWGAPVDDPDHAKNALVSALEMQARLTELNKDFMAKGWPEIKIGVGLNTGPMIVGDMGSTVRKAYTVMGDAVNLGSRLESITKQYGVGIIVGEETREKLKTEFVFRELDRVKVKGKDEAVAIYEPLGREGEPSRAELDELKQWGHFLRTFRAQDWDSAEVALLNLSRANSRYLYEKVYAERIAQYRKEPPGADWDGSWKFDTK